MADEIEHPHDRLFRAVFSDATEAASLLQAAVPRKLRENVDWNNLRLVEGTFVDDALRQSESDLLFEAGYGKETERHGKGKDRLRLYLLFEHQSTPDVWMRYRLLKYCCRIWDADLRDDPRRTGLRPVVPVVFYQGVRDWQHSTEYADLFPSAVRARAAGPDGPGPGRCGRRAHGPHCPVVDDGGLWPARGCGAGDGRQAGGVAGFRWRGGPYSDNLSLPVFDAG